MPVNVVGKKENLKDFEKVSSAVVFSVKSIAAIAVSREHKTASNNQARTNYVVLTLW